MQTHTSTFPKCSIARQQIARVAIATTLAAILAPAPAFSQASGTYDPIMGQITLFAGVKCPSSTVEAKGQIMNIVDNQALFSILAQTFGGDGQTTFALPDFSANVPLAGMRYCITTNGEYPTRP